MKLITPREAMKRLAFLLLMLAAVPGFAQENAAVRPANPLAPHAGKCAGGAAVNHYKNACARKKTSAKRMNGISPAARSVPPDPYTNPDLEKMRKDKEQWWDKGWAPME